MTEYPSIPNASASASVPAKTSAFPELLSPAGDWDCARAAVENGADAIYFGLERFNARMRAQNFTTSDLPELMGYLHRRGVKGYVTFNTLVFANELDAAEEQLRAIIAAGVDAAIVQDVGVCRLIRRLSPDFPIHASTQMTVTSAAGVEFVRRLGCSLVVLARECSIREIEGIRHSLSEFGVEAGSMPLEVFVHGALCVAYSGQCLTSEALGGRSANRGECAQACRMPYELVSDGKTVPLGDRRYLLSPQDLSGLEVLPELVRSGVASLKIEGRLKTAEYVANITGVYRRALDRILAKPTSVDGHELWKESRYPVEMAFSRGLYTGWMRGIDNQELAHARFAKKRGVFLGKVARVAHGKIALERTDAPMKPGDGVVFDAGRPDLTEQGGRIYTVDCKGRETWLGFGHGDLDIDKIAVGDRVWKTSDPELDKSLRQTFAGTIPRFRRPLDFQVRGVEGGPLTVQAKDRAGHVVELHSAVPLFLAQSQPLDTERLGKQLGRLGNTPFRLGTLDNRLAESLMLPVSELNRMRREVVSRLEALLASPRRWTLLDSAPRAAATSLRTETRVGADSPGPLRAEAALTVLVRTMPQLEAAVAAGVDRIYCEFEHPKRYLEAVEFYRGRVGEKGGDAGIFVAPPRIHKPGEEWILKQVRASDADGYLMRNYDHLRFFRETRRVGDFSFNIANRDSAEYFMAHHDVERLTASYDLNAEQLGALLRSAPPAWFEITLHQHMPMFHMEHCVYCAFLSTGTDYRNCGRPCDRHEVKLRDRVGAEHVLKADVGCRNTVFNARAQTGAESASRLISLGARHFRIEFLNETPAQLTETLSRYQLLLRGEMSGTELWRHLKLQNQLGVTRGPRDREEVGEQPRRGAS